MVYFPYFEKDELIGFAAYRRGFNGKLVFLGVEKLRVGA